ncbi:MAG: NAD+ synthase [Bacteroidetes bacterium]|nr:NAD+ synthase [Bacteroidota bacterium]
MRIALAQLNYHIGDFENNIAQIKSAIRKAKELPADVVVFSELAVCGYPPRDFLEFDDFISSCHKAILSIAEECRDIAVIVGAPSVNPSDKGKPLYNSAYFLADGKIRSVFHKTLLPNYDVFDEYRYFEPNRLPYAVVEYKKYKFAVTICEDLWNIADDPLYVRNPMDELIQLNPDLVINIAASPFHYDQPAIRKDILVKNAVKYKLPFFYLNHVGGQTELLFDGGSMVIDPQGNVFDEMKYFEEDLQVYNLNDFDYKDKNENRKDAKAQSKIELIHDALVMGICDYFGKMELKTAILGLSGGIDSAVTLVLAAKALGCDNVRAILLPSRFSSEHSKQDAVELADRLNVRHDIIAIDEAFGALEDTLKPYFKDLPFNLAEENMQARARAVILMALSNKFGYILLNTSNKSEAAVGYGTLYGDMCGGISVLGDLYKTQVYELAEYINRKKEIIPQNTITKPPSAELRPGQKDSDSLPEYDVLDRILYGYIELRKGPNELIREGFDPVLVKRVLRLVNTSEYKRYQTPPILRVSPKAFGTGRRMPIVGKYLS